MRTIYEERIASARQIECTIVHGTARLCRRNFGAFCKHVWPTKTAEMLAAEVGCSVRAAAYEISGEREPSVKSFHLMCGKLLE